MKKNKTILELLMQVPKECTKITIKDVEMVMIDEKTKKQLLGTGVSGTQIHSCTLANGTFLFTTNNHELSSLYKVIEN